MFELRFRQDDGSRASRTPRSSTGSTCQGMHDPVNQPGASSPGLIAVQLARRGYKRNAKVAFTLPRMASLRAGFRLVCPMICTSEIISVAQFLVQFRAHRGHQGSRIGVSCILPFSPPEVRVLLIPKIRTELSMISYSEKSGGCVMSLVTSFNGRLFITSCIVHEAILYPLIMAGFQPHMTIYSLTMN
jgi:hypothetical protein